MNNRTNDILKVLSLEDSDVDFELIIEQLISAGLEIDLKRAASEQEFTSLIQCNHFDVILADYMLPQFDAFKALKLCQEHCPEIPFICVSGSIGEIKAIELLKNGAVDYVIKDRMERLPFSIRRALEDTKEKNARRNIEKSLKLSEEKYRTIFENVQDVFYQTDLAGIIREISPSIKYFSEFNAGDLVGKPVFEIYANPKEREQFLQILSKNGEVRDYEIKLKTKTGEIKYASINARLICNPDGNPDHIDGAIRDITLRKLAEESLQQSETDLNLAQEIAKMGSWKLDMRTYKHVWSKNMYVILGLNPFEKEVDNDYFLNLVHPDDRYLIDLNHQKIVNTKSRVSFEFRFLMPDGEIIWIQNIIVPVFTDDELVELRGVNLDITEKKRVEQELILAKEKAEASDHLKSSFLNMISHEIRTPLTEIQGYGQVFTFMNLTQEEKEEYLTILKTSSKRLINTVTSFIDMSMIASGNQSVTRSNCHLEYLINLVGESYNPICESKKIELVFEFPDNTSNAIIFTDEELLTKILNHLVDNAVKFTTDGQISIGYHIHDNSYFFHVKDTGIGISEEMQQTIFRDFMQADNSNTRLYEGSGLGLSIAAGFIRLLDGRIWVESTLGKGSTFHFSLPIS